MQHTPDPNHHERRHAIEVKLSRSGVAVDQTYYWQPMSTCPLNCKVQLLNEGKVAVYGTYDGKLCQWLGWAPLPKEPHA